MSFENVWTFKKWRSTRTVPVNGAGESEVKLERINLLVWLGMFEYIGR